MSAPRLAILRDFPEENWVSMNIVAEMLLRHLQSVSAPEIAAQLVCPPFRWRACRVPRLRAMRVGFNCDRLLNRQWDYPRFARGLHASFDAFHVADHSYAMLVHSLPANRSGVFCHDLDAFGCLLNPRAHPRPRWFRCMTRRILRGMQRAAVVFHATDSVARQIREHGLVDPARLVFAPLGVAGEFTPSDDDTQIDSRVVRAGAPPFLLHVGSCVPRKRIDVLLDVFAEVRRARPQLCLVKVGGEWTASQRRQIDDLKLEPAIRHLVHIDRRSLAWLYRRAAAVLVTSEAEGFGLPVVEALACAAPVVASDIPTLREVGGDAVVYGRVGDVGDWARTILDPSRQPTRELRLAQAAKFSWSNHARTIAQAYIRLLEGS